jgi:hypothetical protein
MYMPVSRAPVLLGKEFHVQFGFVETPRILLFRQRIREPKNAFAGTFAKQLILGVVSSSPSGAVG